MNKTNTIKKKEFMSRVAPLFPGIKQFEINIVTYPERATVTDVFINKLENFYNETVIFKNQVPFKQNYGDDPPTFNLLQNIEKECEQFMQD